MKKYEISRKVALFCVALALFLMAGCASREHIRPDYGVKTKEFFARQRVHKEASADPPRGLDSEEAAIVQATYRKNLGKESGAAAKQPGAQVLLLKEGNKDDED